MSTDKHLDELGEAARRAGSIVTEHIDAIVAGAERRAEEIREDAERDAQHNRRAALDSAQMLLERINALERPLGELVLTIRGEMERVAGEWESGDHVDALATAIPAELDRGRDAIENGAAHATTDAGAVEEVTAPQPELVPDDEAPSKPETDLSPTESKENPDSDSPADERKDADTAPPPIPVTFPGETKSEAEDKGRRGLFGHRGGKRSKHSAFISKEGHCAVCQRRFMAGSEEKLELSGWRVSGDIGLCPDCQSDGWQLPDGARLPFRRGGG